MSLLRIPLAVILAFSSGLAAFLLADQPAAAVESLKELEARPLMAQETQRVIEMLETIHFRNEEIEDEMFDNLIEEYMERLDFNRLFFLQENLEDYQLRFGKKLSFQLRNQGDLRAAFAIFADYRNIALARTQWALDRLEEDWTFETDESYTYDRSESPWPKSVAEADDLWTKRLKHELIQEILTEKTLEEAEETITKRYERMRRNILEFGSADVQEGFLTKLTQMFDPHSTFFSSDTFEDFNIQMRLSLEGIGAILSEEDGYCTIKELVPGGPANLEGSLKPNDRIVAVAQGEEEAVDIVGMSLRKVVKKIRGDKGSVVKLSVLPADASDSHVEIVEIVRDSVRIDSSRCSAKLIDVPTENGSSMPIGVIEIPTFYGSAEMDEQGNRRVTSVSADVEELVHKLTGAGAQAIVLDLRMNGGGLLDEAIEMTGLFIQRGPVVQVKEPYGRVQAKADRNPKVAYSGPLAVLTSRYSASASEIVAGALQNYGRAIIIGNDSTHGKGTVQTVISLEDYVFNRVNSDEKAGATKLTVQKFYLPNGFSTQRKGVSSDIRIPSIEEIFAEGEADLPNALSWDYVKPARFEEMNLKKSFVEGLMQSSSQRQDSLEEFDFLNKRLDYFKERDERTEISLNLEERKLLKESDKMFLDSMEEEQRRLAIFNFNETEFTLDGVESEDKDEPLIAGDLPTNEEEETTVEDGDASDTEIAATDGLETIEDGEEEKEELPRFDIQLRETLRIMVDAVERSPNPSEWVENASPIAYKSRFESLVN